MKMFQFKEMLEKEGIILSFSGTISQPILSSIGETIESEFDSINIDANTVLKVFAVFTEQMQNIMSYSKERREHRDNRHASPGICVVGLDKRGKYYVNSANIMDVKDEQKVCEKIDYINSLDESGLKTYYKELRRSGKGVHNRGAGLGFLEMAKKSSESLEYHITKIDSERSFFEIKVYI
ncbi:MAG: SiaB family protein kinase [Sulfurimonadaceae bacterium]